MVQKEENIFVLIAIIRDMKPRRFETRHIRVEIRYPTDKHLDLTDPYDYENAIKMLAQEWDMLDEDIGREVFNRFIIHPAEAEDKKRLPE